LGWARRLDPLRPALAGPVARPGEAHLAKPEAMASTAPALPFSLACAPRGPRVPRPYKGRCRAPRAPAASATPRLALLCVPPPLEAEPPAANTAAVLRRFRPSSSISAGGEHVFETPSISSSYSAPHPSH
jgi:hypothetical protein